jgi:hypothetical protein
MNRYHRTVLSVLVLLLSAHSAFAMPNFLEDFRKDPFRRTTMDGCSVCHVNPQGGGDRNPFGQAFERAGEKITVLLRAQFPDHFVFPSQTTGNVTIHFSDPENKQVVVETGGIRNVVDIGAKTVNGATATGAAVADSSGAGANVSVGTSASKKEIPVDAYAREGAFFGMQVVNLPNGKPEKKGGVDFLVQHRFTESVSDAGLGGLYGFDSRAVIAFGARVGLTDRISMGVMRSNFGQTIEFNSMLSVARQSKSSPVTLALRAGVEGTQNFHIRHSPFIQPVVTRTFADRVSFLVAPIFAFNTRDEDSFLPPDLVFGADHNNTIGLGLGTGIRLLPTTSLVGEYIPRVHGFRGEIKDRPGVSMGLEKSTYRHTFELVLSRQFPLTTAQYAVQGTDTFQIGFNIFRRIR